MPPAGAAEAAAGANEEAGLSKAQIRARSAAKKYREAQDRELSWKRRSGSVWMVVAFINTVR